jgi:hypothetical protein
MERCCDIVLCWCLQDVHGDDLGGSHRQKVNCDETDGGQGHEVMRLINLPAI